MWLSGFPDDGANACVYNSKGSGGKCDAEIGDGRCITSSLHQAKTGARRAPLKMGAEVPVSARRRDKHVRRNARSTVGSMGYCDEQGDT
jgi:hypothetical protein